VVLRRLITGSLLMVFGGSALFAAQAAPPTAKPAPPATQTPAAKPAAPAQTKDQNLRAYVELLRSDVRAQKVAILTELMELNEAEDAAFWPIYRQYEDELNTLNDERVSLIKTYADSYPNVSDAVADTLAHKSLDLQTRRTALQAKYYEKMKQALSPKLAARFLQVEHQLLLIIDLQIAAALPIVQ